MQAMQAMKKAWIIGVPNLVGTVTNDKIPPPKKIPNANMPTKHPKEAQNIRFLSRFVFWMWLES